MSAYRRVKITQSVVDAAKPEAIRYILTDTNIPGFWLVVEPSGRRTFKLRYRVGGGRGGTIREPKIADANAMKCEKARQIAANWHATVAKGGDPSGDRLAQRAAPTMAALFDRYMTDHAKPHKRVSSVAEDKRLITAYLSPAFGRHKVAEVTRADVDRFHKGLADKPYRANRCIALLSKAFNLAEMWGWRADATNPCRHVKKFAEAQRQRFLSAEEMARLGEVLRSAEQDGYLILPIKDERRENPRRVSISRWSIAAIRLLLFTGARRGEILKLKWAEVDTAAATIKVRSKEAKTIKGEAAGFKTLHLSPPALEVLASLPVGVDNPYVIQGGKQGMALVNLKDPWKWIRQTASLTDVRLHDLRHSFASVAAAQGASLPIIGALLGHAQPATTARYSHLAANPLKATTSAIGNNIAAALSVPKDSAELIDFSEMRRTPRRSSS